MIQGKKKLISIKKKTPGSLGPVVAAHFKRSACILLFLLSSFATSVASKANRTVRNACHYGEQNNPKIASVVLDKYIWKVLILLELLLPYIMMVLTLWSLE